MNKRTLALPAFAFFAVALAAGCGGTYSGVTPPQSAPTADPSSVSVPVSGSSSQAVQVAAGAVTTTLVIPAATSGAGGTLTVAGAATQPAGTATLAKTRDALPPGATVLAFLSISSTTAVTFSSSLSLAFLLPSSVSTGSPAYFYVAELKPGANAWTEPLLGPGRVNGQIVSFGIGAQALVLAAGETYYFALYSDDVAPTSTPSPQPSGSPSGSPSASPTASPAASPTPLIYTFEGSSTVLSLTQGVTPSAAALSAYQNVTASVQFAAPSATGSLDISDALDNGDITPAGFPADNATAGYTPVIYISVVNPGVDVNFGGHIPAETVTKSTGFGAMTTCNLDVYQNNGNGAAWSAPGVSGSIGGTSVTIGPATLPNGTVDFGPGSQQLLAISCH